MHLLILVVPEVDIRPLEGTETAHVTPTADDRGSTPSHTHTHTHTHACHLEDGSDEQPVPVQVLLVVQDVTVP